MAAEPRLRLSPGGAMRALGLLAVAAFIGLLVSVFAFTVVVTSTPLTALTSRMPRHGLLVLVLAVLGITTLASAFVPEYWMLASVRVVGGVAHGLFWAVVAAYASRLVSEEQIGRAISVTLGGGKRVRPVRSCCIMPCLIARIFVSRRSKSASSVSISVRSVAIACCSGMLGRRRKTSLRSA